MDVGARPLWDAMRDAAVVLGSDGPAEDVVVLTRALGDPELLEREPIAWALAWLPPVRVRTCSFVRSSRHEP